MSVDPRQAGMAIPSGLRLGTGRRRGSGFGSRNSSGLVGQWALRLTACACFLVGGASACLAAWIGEPPDCRRSCAVSSRRPSPARWPGPGPPPLGCLPDSPSRLSGARDRTQGGERPISGTPGSTKGSDGDPGRRMTATRVDEIIPARALVRPRVLSPEGGSFCLEDEVYPFAKGGGRGAIRIDGPTGSGKSTALRHLLASLPPGLDVLALDGPEPRRPWPTTPGAGRGRLRLRDPDRLLEATSSHVPARPLG